MMDPDKGELIPFDSMEEAKKGREKVLAQKRKLTVKGAKKTTADHPIYFKGQPVMLVTPEGEAGTFIISKLGRRVVRLQAIPIKLYNAMIGDKK